MIKKSNEEIYFQKRFEVSAKPWGERRAVRSGSLVNYSASVKKINRRKEISRYVFIKIIAAASTPFIA